MQPDQPDQPIAPGCSIAEGETKRQQCHHDADAKYHAYTPAMAAELPSQRHRQPDQCEGKRGQRACHALMRFGAEAPDIARAQFLRRIGVE